MLNRFCSVLLTIMAIAMTSPLYAQTTHSHMGVHVPEREAAKMDAIEAHIDNTGADWVRYTLYWADLETSDDTYAFVSEGVDDDLKDLDAAGKNILVVIARAPQWVYSMGGTTTCDEYADPPYDDKPRYGRCAPDTQAEYDAYGDFLAAVDSLYSFVDHYEVWNEAFWRDSGRTEEGLFFEHTPVELEGVIEAAHDSVGASNTILCCGFMPSRGGTNSFVGTLMDNVGSDIDILTVHKYTGGNATDDIKDLVEDVQGDDTTNPSTKVWVTEFGMGGQSDHHIDDLGQIIDDVFSDTYADQNWGVSFVYPFYRTDEDGGKSSLTWDAGAGDFDPVPGSYCRMVAEAGNLSVVSLCIDDLTVLPASVPPNTNCVFRASHNGTNPTRWAWSTSAGTIQSTDDDEATITTPWSDFYITVEVDEYYSEQTLVQVDSQSSC